MAYKAKEKSVAVEMAKNRLAAMKQIDTKKGRVIDYGDQDNPCTTATVAARVKAIEESMAEYNGLLDQADAAKNKIERGEDALREECARALAGATAKFGRDSDEVEQMGGTRQSERKPAQRKAKGDGNK